MKDTLSEEFLKAADSYLRVDTPLARADLCFVCGSNTRATLLAQHAAELYYQGYFDRILVSGGSTLADGKNEGESMRDTLLDLGIPEDAIILENKAKNTGDNMINSLPILEKEIGLKNIKTVIVVGQEFAARRFLMTMQKHWPEVQKMFSAPSQYGVARDQWQNSPRFMCSMLNDGLKIPQYKEKDFLTDIDLEKIKKEAQALKDSQPPPVARPRQPKK